MGMMDRDWYKEHHQKKTAIDSNDSWYRPKEFRKDANNLMRQAEVKNGLCMRSFFSGFFLACCAWLIIPEVAPFLIEWVAVGYFLILELIKL
jgi:hypothetical protein